MRRSISGWQQHDGQRRRCLFIFSPCSCMIVPATAAAVMAATHAPVLVIIASTKTPNKRENRHQLL